MTKLCITPFLPFHISTERIFCEKPHYTLCHLPQNFACSLFSLFSLLKLLSAQENPSTSWSSLSLLEVRVDSPFSSRPDIDRSLLELRRSSSPLYSLSSLFSSSFQFKRTHPLHGALSLLDICLDSPSPPVPISTTACSHSAAPPLSLSLSSLSSQAPLSSREHIHFTGLSLFSTSASTSPSPPAPVSTAASSHSHSTAPPPLSSPSPALIYPSSPPSPPSPIKSPLTFASSTSPSLERISPSPASTLTLHRSQSLDVAR